MKDNSEYKGEWSAKPTSNPAYDDDGDGVGRDHAKSLIAFGFTTAADRPSLIAETISLFDLPEDIVSTVSTPFMRTEIISSSSVKETASKFSLEVGIEARYKAFSGTAQTSTERVSSSRVAKLRVDRLVRSEMFRTTIDDLSPHNYLKDSVKEFLLNESPERVVSRLGEFYAEQLTLGGVFQSTHVKDASETDSSTAFSAQVTAKADFLIASAAGSVGTSVSSSEREELKKISTKYMVKGGDTTLWLSLGGRTVADVQRRWAASVTAENLYPIRYKLRPLWMLLKPLNAAKGAALERFLKAKWEAEDRSIPNLPKVKVTCLSWSKFNSCGAKMIVPRADSVSNPSYGRCCRTPNGCYGRITSFHRYGSTRDNCGGHFSVHMADRWAAPDSGAPFMVGGSRRRQQWRCGGSNERSHCGGGNCMKAHTNSRRRFPLECGQCTCVPDR